MKNLEKKELEKLNRITLDCPVDLLQEYKNKKELSLTFNTNTDNTFIYYGDEHDIYKCSYKDLFKIAEYNNLYIIHFPNILGFKDDIMCIYNDLIDKKIEFIPFERFMLTKEELKIEYNNITLESTKNIKND